MLLEAEEITEAITVETGTETTRRNILTGMLMKTEGKEDPPEPEGRRMIDRCTKLAV